MTWEEMLTRDLRASAQKAAGFLRVALNDDDPRTIVGAVQHIMEARGTLAGLGFTKAEQTRLLDALSRGIGTLERRVA